MSERTFSSPRARAERFTRLLNIHLPILLAPMAGACPPSLSVAVADAGGLGACGALMMTPDEIVWYLFEDSCLFIATSSKTRKAHNVAARPKASLMVDARKPGTERGVTAAGRV